MKLRTHYPFYFVSGALVLYVVFFIIPSLSGIAYAFTDWNSYTTDVNFVGLDNFKTIFASSENYSSYIINTFSFTLITIALKTVFGLGLALLLNEGIRRFVNLYRVLIYLPAVLPTLAVALIFRSILNPATGVLNVFCEVWGWMRWLNRGWLTHILRCSP